MQILKYGDRGPMVISLQHLLNGWPTRLMRLKCDGDFGKHTIPESWSFSVTTVCPPMATWAPPLCKPCGNPNRPASKFTPP